MNSSGIRRGLAVLAVSAVAAVGLPLAATADSINDQVGDYNIVLYSFPGGIKTMSLKNDGTDSTVTLAAGAGADINQVTFQYRIDPAGPWQNIATTTRNDDGAFKVDWAPDLSLVDVTIDMRVIGALCLPAVRFPDHVRVDHRAERGDPLRWQRLR